MEVPTSTTSTLDSSEEVDLRYYLRVLLKRKWIVLGVFVSSVVGAALYVLMQPLIYASTVSLLLEPTGPNVMSSAVEEVYVPTNVNLEYYRTQKEILESHHILRQAALRVNAKAHPDYLPKPAGLMESRFASAKAVPETEVERQLVNAFRQRVTVRAVRNSRIIRVTVESTDPQFASDAANTVASVYMDHSLGMRVGASVEAERWMAVRVEELRQKVEESDRTLAEFASRHGLLNVDSRRRLSTQKLSELNAQLVQVETKRAEAEVRFKQIASVVNNPSKLASAVQVLGSPLIQRLRSQEMRAAQKVAELSEKYGPKHPTMIQAASELREVQAHIRNEIEKIYASVNADFDVAKARERVIRKALNQQKGKVIAASRHEVQYRILERQVDTNRQLYDTFLKRLKETDIGTDIRTSNIYVADPAIVSLVPVKPKKRLTILVGALLGLFGGIGLAFFREHMDCTLRSPDEIARHLPGLAFLGFLPVFTEPHESPGGVALAMKEAPQSLFAEHIRSIRTSLMLSAADKPPRSILVTSSVEEEGKSVFATGLAIAYAQLGHATVLIDGDFRKPLLHRVFDLKVRRGLSHFLAGEIELPDIVHPTGVPNLTVIPSGTIPPNPAELVQSRHMKDLLERFKQEDVYVILDSPPVLNLADSIILGHYVDGVVLIVRAAHTSHQTVRITAKTLQEGKAKVLGIVLQRLAKNDLSTYYGSYGLKYYYYSRYYRHTEKPPARHS